MTNYRHKPSALFLTLSCFFFLTMLCFSSNAPAAGNIVPLYVDALEVLEQQVNYRCPGCGSAGYGSAFVHVVDQNGNPVPYALVLGQWSDTDTRQVVSITNAYGWAPFFSHPASFTGEDKPSFTFCINNIIKSGFSYDSGQDAQRCATAD